MRLTFLSAGRALVAAGALAAAAAGRADPAATLLNVSYDVTREFYADYNAAFSAHWQEVAHQPVVLKQSHGGSSAQIRAVIDGLPADIVSMNQALDIDTLARAGLVAPDWAERLPHHSIPYSSTILFVVRAGNPKGIRDWDDLVRPGVSVIIPNPKTSGNGRYSYLAAWGYAQRRPGGGSDAAREFVRRLFANVPVLDAGGRGATTTFAQRGIGDVLLTFEDEAALVRRDFPGAGFGVVVPSASILAENPVTWVDRSVARHHNAALARAYLEYLYSHEGQEIAARHHFRPEDPAVRAEHAAEFPALALFTVADVAGSWRQAQAVHFADGGTFDQIYAPR
jgi:sulfate transport system substrate-binding protein